MVVIHLCIKSQAATLHLNPKIFKKEWISEILSLICSFSFCSYINYNNNKGL